MNNLNSGIKTLASQRKIKVINGLAFLSANKLSVKDNQDKIININFDYCIVATLDHLHQNLILLLMNLLM